jgi:hypothetical protein
LYSIVKIGVKDLFKVYDKASDIVGAAQGKRLLGESSRSLPHFTGAGLHDIDLKRRRKTMKTKVI